MRSMVEGAREFKVSRHRRTLVDDDAPPTALRAVPPPRFAGREEISTESAHADMAKKAAERS